MEVTVTRATHISKYNIFFCAISKRWMESPWDCSNEKSPARQAHRLAGLHQALCEELGWQLRGSAEVEREQGMPSSTSLCSGDPPFTRKDAQLQITARRFFLGTV